jgi:hypothetical protein
MGKSKKVNVDKKAITVKVIGDEDYLRLTDMADSDDIKNWLRNKNTIEFLAV